jgi:aminoglycoside 6-adenylyltransferase
MRTEQEMMELILSCARQDERIRVVGMNGSRTNPKAPRDRFQDYDIVYLVTAMKPFIEDQRWLEHFGNRIIMQTPDAMSLFPSAFKDRFGYLMLFEDANRIDLTLMPLNALNNYLHSDTLIKILLDKDGQTANLPEPKDQHYWVKKPSPAYFSDCCNEFWWVSAYIVKGLCRQELLYAAEHLSIIRKELLRMFSWKIGTETDFSVNMGPCYKYMNTYLPLKTWEKLLKTFRADTAEHIQEALFVCHDLFKEAAAAVADRLNFQLPDYDEKVQRYTAEHLPKAP